MPVACGNAQKVPDLSWEFLMPFSGRFTSCFIFLITVLLKHLWKALKFHYKYHSMWMLTFFNDPLPNFFCTKLCSILKWAILFFFQELNNMFSDFCATCIVKQSRLLCCPGLAYGRSLVIMAVRLDHGWEIPWTGDTDIGVLKRSWIWMKPLLGWEAGDRHELSITCSIRDPGGQVGR